MGGEKELRESDDSRSKYLKTDLILGRNQSNQLDGQHNHRLKIFQRDHRGWWWWKTSTGVVVSPTREKRNRPPSRWQKLALTWAKPALLLSCVGGQRRMEEKRCRYIHEWRGPLGHSWRGGGAGSKSTQAPPPRGKSSSHQIHPLRSTPGTSDETDQEKLPLEERGMSLCRAGHVDEA